MDNFKKYLPQNIMLVLEAVVIWFLSNSFDRETLKSWEILLIWLVVVVINYGVVEAATPKENQSPTSDKSNYRK